jgi:hypothetical protein
MGRPCVDSVRSSLRRETGTFDTRTPTNLAGVGLLVCARAGRSKRARSPPLWQPGFQTYVHDLPTR